MTEALTFDELQYRVIGENAPQWLVSALVVLGIAMTAAVGWQFLEPQAFDPQPAKVANNVPVTAVDQIPAAQVSVPAAPIAAAPVDPAPVREALPTCPEAMTILFRFGKSKPMKRVTRSDLAPLLDWVHQSTGAKLVVEGHADIVGMDESNVLLSYSRAKLIAVELTANGVPSPQVQIAAAGSHAPIEGIPADADENRRVVIRVSDPEGCQTKNN